MALITVLLVVAVLTAIIGRLTLANQVWVRQVEGGAAAAQADQAGRAVQQWVALILARDDNAFDGHTDIWARPLPPLPVGWGELSGRIEDLQGRFNLNSLVTAKGEADPDAVLRFRRLLRILDLNPGIADAVVDWIDPDSRPRGSWGAEDSFYAGRSEPYLAANRPLGTAAELRLVRGIDADVWRKLRPQVTALPQATGINVNTATPEVLAAAVTQWGPPLTALQQGKRWARETDGRPFREVGAFLQEAAGAEEGKAVPGLTVTSEYFMAHAQLKFASVERRITTLYHRGQGPVRIVRQRRELR
ncbi:MAG TPA: type II secretion system minor pseudopilin GspK [Gammaproteobacteria bacterium]|nr:type II secretion system minor pseudopilin GspK [Gammaproteobacteria bacterium]